MTKVEFLAICVLVTPFVCSAVIGFIVMRYENWNRKK